MKNGISAAANTLLKSAPVLGSSTYCRGQPAPAQQDVAIDWLSASTLTHVLFGVQLLRIKCNFVSISSHGTSKLCFLA